MVVSFEDFGCIENWYRTRIDPIVRGRALHPRQFAEVVARGFHQAGQKALNVKYTAMEGPNDMLLTLIPTEVQERQPDQRLQSDQLRLAERISEYSGFPLDRVWHEKTGQVKSTLVGKDESFLDLPFKEGVEYPL
jgi:hypothetical protein